MIMIVIDKPGAKISARGKRIIVKFHNGTKKEKAVKEVEMIIALTSKYSISGDAIRLLLSHGRCLLFSANHKLIGITQPFPSNGTILTRRYQLLAYYNEKGLHLAKEFVYASIINKARTLKYFAHNRRKTNESLAEELQVAASKIEEKVNMLDEINGFLDDIRNDLLGVEGEAARIYFEAYEKLFPKELGFRCRTRRPPQDPVNAALSFGYVILTGKVMRYVLFGGLDPYGGYLHADRSGKPSLVLDIVEEFRQPIVDVVAATCFSKGMLKKEDFTMEPNRVILSEPAKKKFLARLQMRFDKKIKLGTMNTTFEKAIFHQVREIIRFLVGTNPKYKPFLWRWWDGS